MIFRDSLCWKSFRLLRMSLRNILNVNRMGEQAESSLGGRVRPQPETDTLPKLKKSVPVSHDSRGDVPSNSRKRD
jgi:hypothetical protein